MRRKTQSILIIIISITLIVLHGRFNEVFVVDKVSIILLLIAFLPLAGNYLKSIKTGNFELYFRSLSENQKILTFLKEISRGKSLTFYIKKRSEETCLGEAIRLLVYELKNQNRKKLVDEIITWLEEEDHELKWLASEIAGYFGLTEVKNELKQAFKGLDINDAWRAWQLNCFWAYSKITDNYQGLHDFIIRTENESNLDWLLDVYLQMPLEGHANINDYISVISEFLNREKLSMPIKYKAENVLLELKEINN